MITVERNIDVAALTTFGLHARAEALARYDSVDDLRALLADPALPRPLKHIGEGSNLLFVGDFPGTLLHCDATAVEFTVEGDSVKAVAEAGLSMDRLILLTIEKGYWGLENLSGIPGEVGSAAVQNVGAYGVEACDAIETVEALDTLTGDIVTFRNADLRYGYRDSLFKQPEAKDRYIVTKVTFRLSTTPKPVLTYPSLKSAIGEGSAPSQADVRRAVIALRDSKLPNPAVTGCAGSFFKNPVVGAEVYDRIVAENPDTAVPCYRLADGSVKIPAAWLIDRCGWKGKTLGGAAVWAKQPLVLVNADNASPSDIVVLEEAIIESVERRFGITLHPEVEHIQQPK